MVVLGFHLVVTLIGATILSKVSSHFSFGKWLICNGLFYFYCPSDNQLREIVGATKSKEKNKKSKKSEQSNGFIQNSTQNESQSFQFAKSFPVDLQRCPLSSWQVILLKFYWDFQSLVDLALCSVLVFLVCELFEKFSWILFLTSTLWSSAHVDDSRKNSSSLSSNSDQKEAPALFRLNLSLLWLLVSLFVALRSLFSTIKIYFKSPERSEIIILIIFFLIFLIAAMGLILVPERTLLLGIESAYQSFQQGLQRYWRQQSNHTGALHSGPSLNSVRVCLVLLAAVQGALFSRAGLRLARCYLDAVQAAHRRPLRRLLLHAHFFMPLACCLFWTVPVRQALFQVKLPGWMCEAGGTYTDEVSPRECHLTETGLHCLVVWMLLIYCGLRLALFRIHMQAYLDLAERRVLSLRREAGRISNVDFRRLSVSILHCFGVVAVQYVGPLVVLLTVGLLFKSMSAVPWLPELAAPGVTTSAKMMDSVPVYESKVSDGQSQFFSSLLVDSGLASDSMLHEVRLSTQAWTRTLAQFKAIFSPLMFRGLIGFFVFWSLFCVQVNGLFGLMYHSSSGAGLDAN